MTDKTTPPPFPNRQQLSPGPLPVEAVEAIHAVIGWHAHELGDQLGAKTAEIAAALDDLTTVVAEIGEAITHPPVVVNPSADKDLVVELHRLATVNACAALLIATAGPNKDITTAERAAAIAMLRREAGRQ